MFDIPKDIVEVEKFLVMEVTKDNVKGFNGPPISLDKN